VLYVCSWGLRPAHQIARLERQGEDLDQQLRDAQAKVDERHRKLGQLQALIADQRAEAGKAQQVPTPR
jgi:hypothetical protein